MKLDPARWQKISAVFDEVVEAPPDQRDTLLHRLCENDERLRDDVRQLLRAHATTDDFENSVRRANSVCASEWYDADSADAQNISGQIGQWRILRELGRGGMGVVFLAERADAQFEQRVALKLIKRGMDSDAVLLRFLRERQILARLQHPHIARLLDGGITADGRPYFAMEYIDGEPIADYCEKHSLGLEDRLALFLQIGAAVQFAHGNLVVHRDIKPSNILVSAQGRAALLDFGIAKLLTSDVDDADAQTATGGVRPLTPAYAAPEQLRGEPATIATDVFGLGCVLYEVLTGRRPFNVHGSLDSSLAQRAGTTLPPAPSIVTGDPLVPVRRLRGDLDTIVLKALHAEPARRYATADALNADIRNYLSGRPIAARPERAVYRLGKFVSRHRLAVAVSVVAILALMVSTGAALWQARETAREARAAEEVTHFVTGLFADADPTRGSGATITALDLLDQGATRLRSELSTEPVVRARLLHTIATTFGVIGQYDRAIDTEREALQERRRLLAPRNPEIADSMDELGQLYTDKGDYAAAAPLLRDALTMRLQRGGENSADTIESLGNLGDMVQDQGEFAAADTYLKRALAASEKTFGPDSVETARRLDAYATNLDNLGKPKDAVTALRRALAIREKQLGPDAAEVAVSLQNLGVLLDRTDIAADAQTLLQRAVTIRTKIFGPSHPLVGISLLALAGVFVSKDDIDQCQRTTEQALAIFRRSLPDDHPKVTEALNMLAIVYSMRRDYRKSVDLFQDLAQRYVTKFGPDHPDTITVQNNLALTQLHNGQAHDAAVVLRGALAHIRPDNGQRTDVTAYENLSAALGAQGDIAGAVDAALHALGRIKELEGDTTGGYAIALRVVATAQELAGDNAQAEVNFRDGLRIGEALVATQHIATYTWKIPLADFLVGRHRCAEAIPIAQSALLELDVPDVAAEAYWKPEAQFLIDVCDTTRPPSHSAAGASSARAQLLAMPGVAVDVGPTTQHLLATVRTQDSAQSHPGRAGRPSEI